MRNPVVFLALVSAVAIPAAAFAYVRTPIDEVKYPDTCLYWPVRTITWNPASPLGGPVARNEAIAVIRTSFDEWARQSCTDLRFVEGGAAPREVGYRHGGGSNLVIFRDRDCRASVPADDSCWGDGSCSDQWDCWDFDATNIAVTTTTFSPCSGRIYDADIELNAAHFHFTTVDGDRCTEGKRDDCISTDLANTLVHEIGHLIGLGHSPEINSTMFVTARPGETKKRDLHEDDVAGLCDIYPANGPTWVCEPAQPLQRCGEAPMETGSGSCTSAGGGLAPWAVVPALWWLRRRGGRWWGRGGGGRQGGRSLPG